MFDILFDSGNEDSISNPVSEKKKVKIQNDSDQIHSSLGYSSFRAPPLVEYKSVDGYCESKVGKSHLPSFDQSGGSPSMSGLNNLKSISSPIVFKSPKIPAVRKTKPDYGSKPYAFFSVEELSLVKCLRHWSNTNVCAVGLTYYDYGSQQCYLKSVMEEKQWQLLLDTSLLEQFPKLHKLLQIFGTLDVLNSTPRVKVNFCRNLGKVELPLFIESYKLMQKYVPRVVNLPGYGTTDSYDIEEHEAESEMEMNDTLDDYNFSLVM